MTILESSRIIPNVNDEQKISRADYVGEAIDRVVTIEAKNMGMPHNNLAAMYAAARIAAGGRPISMVAAEKLCAAIKPGDRVLLLSGAGYAPAMPKGENDGPPGVASLAKVLYRGLGAVPVYVAEKCHVDPIVASSHAAGVMVKEYRHAKDLRLGASLVVAPTGQADVPEWVTATLDEMKPVAVISAERLGPAADGVIYSATALPFSGLNTTVEHDTIDIAGLVTEATKRGILTIGIGDHGNEIGFGLIREAVSRAMPKGGTLCTVVPTDVLLPAMMSNWGCYAIEAAIAFLLNQSSLIHSPIDEERILRACLGAGGLEAIFTNTEFIADGLDGETSMACMQFLGNIVRKSMEVSTTGLAH